MLTSLLDRCVRESVLSTPNLLPWERNFNGRGDLGVKSEKSLGAGFRAYVCSAGSELQSCDCMFSVTRRSQLGIAATWNMLVCLVYSLSRSPLTPQTTGTYCSLLLMHATCMIPISPVASSPQERRNTMRGLHDIDQGPRIPSLVGNGARISTWLSGWVTLSMILVLSVCL